MLPEKHFSIKEQHSAFIQGDCALCHDVLRHRIGLTYEAEAENITSEDVITEILNSVEIP